MNDDLNQTFLNNDNNYDTERHEKQISSLSKTGYIVSLIAAVLGLIIGVILLIVSFTYFFAGTYAAITINGFLESLILTEGIILLVFGCLLIAFNITNLVFISRNLKNSQAEEHQIFIGVVAIIFGAILGIIGGILVLVGNSNKQN